MYLVKIRKKYISYICKCVYLCYYLCICVLYIIIYVILDHKTSRKAQFYEIEIYTSSES